jgi:hypothetical protein
MDGCETKQQSKEKETRDEETRLHTEGSKHQEREVHHLGDAFSFLELEDQKKWDFLVIASPSESIARIL